MPLIIVQHFEAFAMRGRNVSMYSYMSYTNETMHGEDTVAAAVDVVAVVVVAVVAVVVVAVVVIVGVDVIVVVEIGDFTATSYEGGGLACSGDITVVGVVDLGDLLITLFDDVGLT